ncbi:MAG: hypothetical protein LBT00_08035 [Spirochaetaceae bacterium]|jgi:hypothetical protein|nr:hypothetical protein [Spirochaetaceae bacterium]
MTTLVLSLRASPPSLRAGGTLPSEAVQCEGLPRLDCFAASRLAMTTPAPSLPGKSPRHCERSEAVQCEGLSVWIASPFGFAMTTPVPSLRASPPSLRAGGTLPSEAIQCEGLSVWIASPCGFAMTSPASRLAMTTPVLSLRASPSSLRAGGTLLSEAI